MSLVNDKTSAVLDKAISLRFQRQQLLVGNIANVDTPNYQPVDLAFEGALKEALESREQDDPMPPGFERTNAMHMSGWTESHPDPAQVHVRPDVTNSLDNNGVDLDKEMARVVDNSTHYQTALEVTRRRFNILTELISTMNQG